MAHCCALWSFFFAEKISLHKICCRKVLQLAETFIWPQWCRWVELSSIYFNSVLASGTEVNWAGERKRQGFAFGNGKLVYFYRKYKSPELKNKKLDVFPGSCSRHNGSYFTCTAFPADNNPHNTKWHTFLTHKTHFHSGWTFKKAFK